MNGFDLFLLPVPVFLVVSAVAVNFIDWWTGGYK